VGLKIGVRLRAQNSPCEVVVVKGTEEATPLLCGGVEMLAGSPAAGAEQLREGPAVELGKRYVDDEAGIELLCVRPGIGPLVFGARELTRKSAQPLPASD
jgi:hypothetical protein